MSASAFKCSLHTHATAAAACESHGNTEDNINGDTASRTAGILQHSHDIMKAYTAKWQANTPEYHGTITAVILLRMHAAMNTRKYVTMHFNSHGDTVSTEHQLYQRNGSRNAKRIHVARTAAVTGQSRRNGRLYGTEEDGRPQSVRYARQRSTPCLQRIQNKQKMSHTDIRFYCNA